MANWVIVIIGCIFFLALIACGGIAIQRRFPNSSKLLLLLYVFILIWIARFWVNFSAISGEMTIFEKCLDSFVHALQTFSMDEDYTSYTVLGKELLRDAGMASLAEIYGVVISVLNICAPIMGGAIILEILTGFFPRLRLWMHPRQRKFVFSELNDASIILAEDLCCGDNYQKIVSFESLFQGHDVQGQNTESLWSKILGHQKPFIIFTDAYFDEESEKKTEIFDRAKALGAVCMKTDMQFLSLSRSDSVYYFFIDEDEEMNVSGLSDILDKQAETGRVYPVGNSEDDVKTRMFVFCASNLSIRMVNAISEREDANKAIIIRSIPDLANTAVNLMYEAPLFIPLLNRGKGSEPAAHTSLSTVNIGSFIAEKDAAGRPGGIIPTNELHVTVLGGGVLAEEILKAVYWCGQIAGTQLFVHVVTNNANDFRNKLISSCPELLETCMEGSEALKCYPRSDSPLHNAPYAIIDGLEDDIDAEDIASYPAGVIEKSDYIVVALGEDGRNISTALMLKQVLSRRALRNGETSHPVIAPAIYDKRLADPIAVLHPAAFEPYLIPFALREDRFSCRSVFMSDITVEAWKSGSLYDKKSHEKKKKDEYSYWANINRAIHAPYKVFAFGWISDIDLTANAESRYRGSGTDIQPDDLAFSWMEHRRWNACMRAQGFTAPTEDEHQRFYTVTKQHKDLVRKYHNCLVESTTRGCQMPKVKDFDISFLDALDLVSLKAYQMNCSSKGEEETAEGLQDAEYKHWDDFSYDDASHAILNRIKSYNRG